MNRTVSLVAILAVLSAPGAWAQSGKSPATNAPPQARPAADPAADAFKAWDRDRDGTLSLVEFRAGWQQVQRTAEMQSRLRQQFATVDVNKNNAIDPGEYGSLVLVKQAGKSAPQMSMFDGNRDGKLEFNEYLRLVQTLAAKDAAKGAAK